MGENKLPFCVNHSFWKVKGIFSAANLLCIIFLCVLFSVEVFAFWFAFAPSSVAFSSHRVPEMFLGPPT